MGMEVEVLTDVPSLCPEKSEVERLWADNCKAKSLLGWLPWFGVIEGLRHGIEKTVE